MVRTEFDFLCEMYYGEDVEIRTFIEKIGNSSFTMGHEAWQNGKLKVRGRAVIVHFDFMEKKIYSHTRFYTGAVKRTFNA